MEVNSSVKPYELLDYLFKTIKAEIETESLQKLDDDFYSRFTDLINQKDGELKDYFNKVATEYLVLLFAIRLTKAINGADIRLATKEERYVFHKHDEFRRAIRNFLDTVRSTETKTDTTSRMLVMFNTEIEPFIDSQLHSLGPFEKKDMAYIPEEDALVLSRYGIVEILLGE